MVLFFFNIKRYFWQLVFGIAAVIVSVICESSLASIMANIIDIAINNLDTRYVVVHSLLMASLSLCGIIFGFINIYLSAYVTQNCAFDLRKKAFDKIQEFEFKNIDRFSNASLITRVTDDVNNLQMTFMMMLRLFLRAPINIVFAFVMLLTLDLQMALIVLALIPFLIFIVYFIMKIAMPRF